MLLLRHFFTFLTLPYFKFMGIHTCAVSVTICMHKVGLFLVLGLRRLVFDVEESRAEVLDP